MLIYGQLSSSGASQVTCGSVAVTNPGKFLRWLKDYGPEKIILGADFRHRKVATGGWLSASETDITDFLYDYRSRGATRMPCAPILKKMACWEDPRSIYIRKSYGIEGLSLIASGGISSVEDVNLAQGDGVRSRHHRQGYL